MIIANSHYNIEDKKTYRKIVHESDKKWNSSREYFINSFLNHESLSQCPECGNDIIYSTEDEDEAYCSHCGLVTSASIEYVAGIKIDLPYGRR